MHYGGLTDDGVLAIVFRRLALPPYDLEHVAAYLHALLHGVWVQVDEVGSTQHFHVQLPVRALLLLLVGVWRTLQRLLALSLVELALL